jgi:SAM-dependent methyltransferase
MLDVPPALRRGMPRSVEAWEGSAVALLDLVCDLRPQPLILDVGCGTRFAKVITERDIPVRGYVGVDVSAEIISFLNDNVTDPRMEFHHLDAHNERYNPDGQPLDSFTRLPVGDGFDVISLFSVFTHLAPHDFSTMLRLVRPHIADDGRLIFSLFLGEVDRFEDLVPGSPLLEAVYSKAYARELVEGSGWQVESLSPPVRKVIQHYFVCRPS